MPIDLKKGIPLSKGINLTKLTDQRGALLEQIYIGLGWDVTGPGRSEERRGGKEC